MWCQLDCFGYECVLWWFLYIEFLVWLRCVGVFLFLVVLLRRCSVLCFGVLVVVICAECLLGFHFFGGLGGIVVASPQVWCLSYLLVSGFGG